jgi:hyperosmotically inducible protein
VRPFRLFWIILAAISGPMLMSGCRLLPPFLAVFIFCHGLFRYLQQVQRRAAESMQECFGDPMYQGLFESVSKGTSPETIMNPDKEYLAMNNLGLVYVVLLVAGLLNGCVAMVAAVGGAAAGGYYVASDKRTFAEITEDARITSSINAKFITDDLVNPVAVNVDTYKGVVTLQGTVDDPGTARHAYDIAYSVDGVTQVVSKLTIRSQPMTPWGPVDK